MRNSLPGCSDPHTCSLPRWVLSTRRSCVVFVVWTLRMPSNQNSRGSQSGSRGAPDPRLLCAAHKNMFRFSQRWTSLLSVCVGVGGGANQSESPKSAPGQGPPVPGISTTNAVSVSLHSSLDSNTGITQFGSVSVCVKPEIQDIMQDPPLPYPIPGS